MEGLEGQVADGSLATQLRELAAVDVVGLGLVAVLLVLGMWRGLWWQALRLVGIVVGVLMARILSPETSVWISEQWPDLPYRVAHGIAWLAIFLLTLGAASILGLLGQRLLEVMQLGLANRVGGGLLGAATGVVVHLAVVVTVCQLAPEPFVERNVAGTFTERLVDAAGVRWRVALGADAASEVDRLLRNAPASRREGWSDEPPPEAVGEPVTGGVVR